MWYQLISVWLQCDISWFQLISVDISGIPVFPSVISHCSGISAVWYQLISVWYQLISVDISWYQLISVGYQFPPLWYHTLNLISPWIKLISNLMIQGFNPCIKRKSHRKLVWYFLNHFNQLVGRCVLLNHHSFRSLHSLHSWWFSRTHLPTRWYQWFRKYHTRLSVGFPIKMKMVFCQN